MTWKHDIRLADLPAEKRFEATCEKCRRCRSWSQAELIKSNPKYKQFYCDEVEKDMRCPDRFCRGAIRLDMTHEELVEGWVGGMP